MLNKILLIGNLGKDPELTVTPDGTPVTKFTLAVNRYFKSNTGERKKLSGSILSCGEALRRSASATCIKDPKSILKAG